MVLSVTTTAITTGSAACACGLFISSYIELIGTPHLNLKKKCLPYLLYHCDIVYRVKKFLCLIQMGSVYDRTVRVQNIPRFKSSSILTWCELQVNRLFTGTNNRERNMFLVPIYIQQGTVIGTRHFFSRVQGHVP